MRRKCSAARDDRRRPGGPVTTGRDLTALPKAHLHLHLEGGMRMETLQELAERYGIPLPPVGSYTSFTEFVVLYEAACGGMRTHDDLRRLMREAVEDAAAAGAVWLEAAVRPTLHRGKFGGDADVLETLLEEGRKSGAEMGVGLGVLMTVDRRAPLALAFEEAWPAVA